MKESELRERFELYTGRKAPHKLRVVEDTTEFMGIERDQVVRVDGRYFAVQGNTFEGRFGIDEQPKFWVKRTVDLADGSRKVLKLEFRERMAFALGPMKVRSLRSPEKEARILGMTRGDDRFMQGLAIRDAKGNIVRVIDHIRGESLYHHLMSLDKIPHEEYFENHFPDLFAHLICSVEAIGVLHEKNVCHGDIRNDHVLIEEGTGRFRWIDFDLGQETLDLDVWCLGNLVFLVTAKDDVTWRLVEQGAYGVCHGTTIDPDDTMAFFPHRIANLRKVFPYIPEDLNNILLRYSRKAHNRAEDYKSVFRLLDDLRRCCAGNGFNSRPS